MLHQITQVVSVSFQTQKRPTARCLAKESQRYSDFIQRLQLGAAEAAEASEGSAYVGSRILVLPEHHGFGFAVKVALEEVDTDYATWSYRTCWCFHVFFVACAGLKGWCMFSHHLDSLAAGHPGLGGSA